MADKKADLAGPGIGDYTELEHVLPADYSSLLSPKDTQRAIFELKTYIEDQPLQRTEPDDGHGSADRGRRVGRE